MNPFVALVYLLIPAYFANMAPVLVKPWFPFLAYPIDAHFTWKGTRILGDHKTWRGLIAGVGLALFIAYIQHEVILWGVTPAPWYVLGLALGGGALIGDMVESFLKRRKGIAPGRPWFPFDQLDFVIGSLVCLLPWYRPALFPAVGVLLFSLAGHIGIKQVGRLLGLS